MTRTGLLLVVVAALAAVAVGVLYVAGFLPTGHDKSELQNPPSAQQDWAATMAELATSQGLVLSFSDGNRAAWDLTDGHQIERFRFSGTEQTLARLSSAIPLNPNDRLSGLRARLPLDWVQSINGKTIEIGLVAKSSANNGAADVSALYATLQTGNSGWRTLQLSGSFQVLKFNFKVPLVEGGYTQQPMVIIRSDTRGEGRGVELVGVYVKPID